jgi:hypothetical protein
VWLSIVIEIGVMLGITVALYVMIGYLNINVSQSLYRPANIGIALLPALLWLAVSWWPEQAALEPRPKLAAIFVISALSANAVGTPLVDRLAPYQWLSSVETIDRIIGYTATVGIVQTLLVYLVVRYTILPGELRIRLDATAYCAAAAIGYATVTNLHIVSVGLPSPDVIAIRVFSNTVIHVAASSLIAYGLAELQFRPYTFFMMPVMLLLAAFVTGIAIAARSSVVNASFFLGFSATRPFWGLVFSLVMVTITLSVVAFLFDVAERQEREAVASREV